MDLSPRKTFLSAPFRLLRTENVGRKSSKASMSEALKRATLTHAAKGMTCYELMTFNLKSV